MMPLHIRAIGQCPKGGLHEYVMGAIRTQCQKCGDIAILPHEGPQDLLLSSRANIAVFGGSKGGGKSFALLMEALRHYRNGRFGAVIFRRESPQIYNVGGLWDTSEKIFPAKKAIPIKSRGEWAFPSGARVKFSHLEYDKDVNAWDGQQVPMIGFDELTAFTEKQFWYMLTINRSTCGVPPYIRATCNPDADSWVALLLKWWIDQDTGFAIPERSGKIRWFVRPDGASLVWADTKDELEQRYPGLIPRSFTFIRSRLEDNPTLEAIDPGYRANLLAQPLVEQQRLLYGNWKIRPAAGLKFPRDKWRLLPALPAGFVLLVRFWDKAYTEGGSGAKTAGVLIGQLSPELIRHGLPPYVIVDCQSGRWGDAERESKIQATAHLDRARFGNIVTIGVENEGGAGKQATSVTLTGLAGFDVYAERPHAKKHLRWSPLAAQQQIGNVGVYAPENPDAPGFWDWADFIRELDALAGDEDLDKGKLKDKADAASGAFKGLTGGYFGQHSELTCSGGDDDDKTPMTKKEIEQLPDFLRDLVQTHRGLAEERANERNDGWRD